MPWWIQARCSAPLRGGQESRRNISRRRKFQARSRWALAVEKCAAQRQDSEGETEYPVQFVVNASQDFGGLRLAGVFLGRLFGLALADRARTLDLDVERSPRYSKQASLNIR